MLKLAAKSLLLAPILLLASMAFAEVVLLSALILVAVGLGTVCSLVGSDVVEERQRPRALPEHDRG